jgi:hypothetical protein
MKRPPADKISGSSPEFMWQPLDKSSGSLPYIKGDLYIVILVEKEVSHYWKYGYQ